MELIAVAVAQGHAAERGLQYGRGNAKVTNYAVALTEMYRHYIKPLCYSISRWVEIRFQCQQHIFMFQHISTCSKIVEGDVNTFLSHYE